jgi:hypothetical protein
VEAVREVEAERDDDHYDQQDIIHASSPERSEGSNQGR